MEYSVDGGASWNTYSAAISIDHGKNLYLKCNNQTGWSHSGKISKFVITGDVSISGNIMWLLDNGATSGEEGDITTIPTGSMCFGSLFYELTAVTSVSDDFLPATGLARYCYYAMFSGCTSLTTAPDLPATTLAESCYESMFMNCSKLNSIRIGYTGNYYLSNFDSWVKNVASSGIFYYKGTDSLTNFGFPDGWSKNPN